mgnify:CR=1 FL=1
MLFLWKKTLPRIIAFQNFKKTIIAINICFLFYLMRKQYEKLFILSIRWQYKIVVMMSRCADFPCFFFQRSSCFIFSSVYNVKIFSIHLLMMPKYKSSKSVFQPKFYSASAEAFLIIHRILVLQHWSKKKSLDVIPLIHTIVKCLHIFTLS